MENLKIRNAREKAFRAGVLSSDYASHTALRVALDTFISELKNEGILK